MRDREEAMTEGAQFDAWSAGRSYEHYMGRWSRKIAAGFLRWLDPPEGADWVEIGCGTGALTEAILTGCAPRAIIATDRSPDFTDHARRAISDSRARFVAADALALPCGDAAADIVVSALVLNFIPDRPAALAEMRRVLRPGGWLSFYVWDYPGGGMGIIDAFWKAAAGLDPAAGALDEGRRFPFCTRPALAELCQGAGLPGAKIDAIEVVTEFPDFDAFWHPFTLGAGPAPGYCRSLADDRRERLKAALEERLGAGRPIRLPARAWAVKASVA
jgi:SAM-dependent methyltransferase